MEHDIRPWGQYWVLDDATTHKVKRILVDADERLSYQYHHHRSEAWTIVSGVGRITLDGVVKDYKVGESIKLNSGPFLDQHAIIKEITNKHYILVLESLGCVLKVEHLT